MAEDDCGSFLQFDAIYSLDNDNRLSSASEFDVFSAAEAQRKVRNSIPSKHLSDRSDVSSANVGLTNMPSATESVESSVKYEENTETVDPVDSQKNAEDFKAMPLKKRRPLSAGCKEKKVKARDSVLLSSASVVLTSEERLLAQLESDRKEREKLKLRSRKALERMKAVQNNHIHNVVRSTKPLTIPSTPKSYVVERLRKKRTSTSPEKVAARKVVRNLKGSSKKLSLTIPKPFSFAVKAKLMTVFSAENQLSNAELLKKFESNARSTDIPKKPFKLTIAKSPKFKTTQRLGVPSSSRAHSNIDTKFVEQTKTIETKHTVTEPKPFQFRVISRICSKPREYSKGEVFSKVAVPKTILRTSVKESTFMCNMSPKTPSSAKIRRKQLKSRPRSVSRELCKNSRICDNDDAKQSTCLKSFVPHDNFFLRSSARHEAFLETFQKTVDHLQSRLKGDSEFHANPLPKTTFTRPRELTKPIRKHFVSVQPVFECDERLRKHREFDRQVAEKMERKKQDDEQRLLLATEKENAQINLLRRTSIEQGGLLFKAKPVITEDIFPASKPPMRPLTQPKSPFLLTKARGEKGKKD